MATRRGLFKLLAGLGILAWGFKHFSSVKYYDGAISDHFNGEIFFDKDGAPAKSLTQVMKWNYEAIEKRVKWATSVPVTTSIPPARADFLVTFLGHASWLYQVDGVNILVDPVYSERVSPLSFIGPKRVCDAGVKFGHLPRIDAVIITHNHYDHLDVDTLKRIHKRDNPQFITPLGNDTIIKAALGDCTIQSMDWGHAFTFKGIKFHCRHWSARGIFDRNKALWACFVLESAHKRILHIGDTGYGNGIHFQKLRDKFKSFDLAIIPIGAYEPRWMMQDQHVNPQEAVQIFNDVNTRHALASHWGSFQLTDEGRDEPVAWLKKLNQAGFEVLEVGASFAKA
jgi:L-ascorbate metabolism protein UlaG (beta-lactamase superfamily)